MRPSEDAASNALSVVMLSVGASEIRGRIRTSTWDNTEGENSVSAFGKPFLFFSLYS